MNLPNSNTVTILKEKDYTELLTLAYYYGWNPRGNYAGLPHRSDILRRSPQELYRLEAEQKITFERTEELLEALDLAFFDLEEKNKEDYFFRFESPYAPFQTFIISFDELHDFLAFLANVHKRICWFC